MSANEKIWVDCGREATAPSLKESLQSGLAVLWRAYICSKDIGANMWDLAVPSARLHEAGMTSADLRWMISKGLAEHRQETTALGQPHRSFGGSGGYFFNNRTCLILTTGGAALAEDVFRGSAHSRHETLPALAEVASPTNFENPRGVNEIGVPVPFVVKPRWDVIRRELTVGGRIVKRFRVPARNQETILSVFEEEGWSEHIHDPLPVTHDIDAPTRLHDAINRLNRCQINPLLRFHGDGKGTGVFWELNRPTMLE